jgi:hypothetical protein
MLMMPVSDIRGSTPSMSWLSYGVKVIVMVVERPADILPDGVYWIKKKSYVKWIKYRSYLNAVMEGQEFERVE